MRRSIVDGVIELDDIGESDLLIVFAHRDAQRFAFETVSRSLRWAKLFVRDPSLRGWHNGELPGTGNDIAESATFIRKDVGLDRYERVVTLGSSMGGYAALFGALLGVEGVLAFNPQTLLDRIFPLAQPEHLRIENADLSKVVWNAPSTRFDIVIGDDAVDLCHAAHLTKQPNVRIWTLLGSSHLLSEELNRRGELSMLLRKWFQGDRSTLSNPKRC